MTMLVQCENAAFRYDRHIAAENISFAVEPGDFLCILGENGSGKSTLLRGLLGLETPFRGRVAYGPSFRRAGVGYLPQQTVISDDFPATVWEVVLSGCLARRGPRPFYSARDKQRAESALAQLDIVALKRQSYRRLSGGQRQRVLLARALCAADQLLCLDEPAAGLDPLVTAELYRLLSDLNHRGLTVVMVSHDVPGALETARHILHLHTRPLFYGDVSAYRSTDLCRALLGGNGHA